MAVLVSDVIAESAALLNDPSQTLYTNTKILPFVKKAYQELENHCIANGIPVVNEVSAVLDVAAAATTIATQPTDMVEPIWLGERPDGSSTGTTYTPMIERAWDPNEEQTDTLRYWVWREESIKLLGATAAREVLLRYHKNFGAGSITTASTIAVSNGKTFLAARSAALASVFLGENESRAAALQNDADVALETLIATSIRRSQNLPARRRPFKVSLRRSWW